MTKNGAGYIFQFEFYSNFTSSTFRIRGGGSLGPNLSPKPGIVLHDFCTILRNIPIMLEFLQINYGVLLSYHFQITIHPVTTAFDTNNFPS
jgi:hypothetical protein